VCSVYEGQWSVSMARGRAMQSLPAGQSPERLVCVYVPVSKV